MASAAYITDGPAHIDRHAQGFLHLGAGGAELDKRVHVEADTAVAAGGDADRQGDQLLGLGVEGTALVAARASVEKPCMVSGCPDAALSSRR